MAVLQKIIDERRAGISKSYDDNADLLTTMLESDLFKNDTLIKEELFTFFLAGM